MKTQQKKRTFSEIRDLILQNVSGAQKTLNQIASETGINWKTVDNHITYLIGKGFVREIFSSRYVRIVEITDRGMDQIQKLKTKKPESKFVKKGEVKI